MEKYDLHLVIGKKLPESGLYPLTVKTAQDKEYTASLHIPFSDRNFNVQLPAGYDLGLYVKKALIDADLWRLVDECFTSAKFAYSQGALLFEIQATELYPLPWENIFDAPEWTPFSEVFTVVRYLPKPSSVVVIPLQLPIDVLIVADSTKETLEILPTDGSLRYFRANKATGVSASHLRSLLSSLKYDIVHITGRAEFRNNQTSVLFPELCDLEISPGEMLSLLIRCGARLLVLHGINGSYGALLNFAHNILNEDGPTIIVTRQQQIPSPWNFDELYLQIVHDQSLDSVLRSIPRDMQLAMLLASGGADVLRISPVAPRLYAKLNNQLQAAIKVQEILSAQVDKVERTGDFGKAEPLKESLHFVDEMIRSLEGEIKPEYLLDFTRESGGMEPMKNVAMLSEVFEKWLRDAQTRTKRVVNSSFCYGERKIGREESLTPNTLYNYEIQIGVASENSNVRNAVTIPEQELARFYSEEGIKLRVVLYSSDFQIEEADKIFTLPPPPNESIPVTFDVMTPNFSGIARIRVCIYFEQNLIQSLMVKAVVGELEEKTDITGNVAEVDYSLSNSLANVERFPSRTLNIAMNECGDGTHCFYVLGSKLKRHFDFGEGKIKNAVTYVRNVLQNICSEKDSRGNIRYKYKPDNSGNEKDFVKDVKALAEFGYNLYADIITNQDRAFKDQLKQAIGKSNATIQISSTKSAKYVFPWTLVYDKPLVQGNYDVCPQFLSDLKKRNVTPGHLPSQTCLLNGCQYEKDTHIICPSGFWGYKHIIEQPLTVKTTNETGDQEAQQKIVVKGIKTSVMMGVSLNLCDIEDHRQKLQMLGDVDVDFKQTKQQIGISLQKKDIHLIYFYCHGGRKGPDTWLGIGKGEMLFPQDLIGWEVNWSLEHPFVFINGCHTVDVTPDDFVNFNETLSYCGASGVMGTEISITESLARSFSSGFFRSFLNGTTVGEAVRAQRLNLLENYNLLGLAYTPYCFANLRIEHT